MSEWVFPAFPEPVVVRAGELDGSAEVTGWSAGPAGFVRLDLDGGATLELDPAEPSRLVRLGFDAGVVTRHRGLLGALLGDDRVDEVIALVAAGEPATRHLRSSQVGEVRRIRWSAEELDDTGRRRPTPTADLARWLTRLVTAADLVDEAGASALARVAAAAEVASSLGDDDELAFLRSGADALLERAAGLARAIGAEADVLALTDPALADRLAFALASAGPSKPLYALASRLRSSSRPAAAAAPAALDLGEGAPMAAALGPTRAAPPRVEPEDSPDEYVVAGTPTAPGRLELAPDGVRLTVTVPRGHRGDRWVRVLRADDLLLLALAPLVADGDVERAELIVPPVPSVEHLRAEVTPNPVPSSSPRSRVDGLLAAVDLGRDACRAERLDDAGAAVRHWAECEEAWRAVGDETRANLAAHYRADVHDRLRHAGPALLADLVDRD